MNVNKLTLLGLSAICAFSTAVFAGEDQEALQIFQKIDSDSAVINLKHESKVFIDGPSKKQSIKMNRKLIFVVKKSELEKGNKSKIALSPEASVLEFPTSPVEKVEEIKKFDCRQVALESIISLYKYRYELDDKGRGNFYRRDMDLKNPIESTLFAKNIKRINIDIGEPRFECREEILRLDETNYSGSRDIAKCAELNIWVQPQASSSDVYAKEVKHATKESEEKYKIMSEGTRGYVFNQNLCSKLIASDIDNPIVRKNLCRRLSQIEACGLKEVFANASNDKTGLSNLFNNWISEELTLRSNGSVGSQFDKDYSSTSDAKDSGGFLQELGVQNLDE